MFISLLICACLVQSVDAHGYLKSPRSRNFVAYEDGLWFGGTETDPEKESCPHCLNKGGTAGSCGVTSGGRNYDYPKDTFGNPLKWVNQEMFSEEEIIDVKVVLSAHHKGHFVFKACPLSSLLSNDDVPDEACFNKHPLEFVSDELYGAPKDMDHPSRAYIAPSSMGTYDSSGVYGMMFHYKFKLPKGVSGNTLLQWKYYTANSCEYDGYDNYAFPWNTASLGKCASIPPDGNGTPEQFWNCAEILINDGPKAPTPSPTASPTVSPVIPTPTTEPLTMAPSEKLLPTGSPVQKPFEPTEKKIVAYYASWQYYDRSSLAKPENLDFTKVDRINFAFFQPDVQGNLFGTDSWGDPLVLYGPYNWSPQVGEQCYNSWISPGGKTCNHHHYEKGLIHLVHESGGEIYPSLGGWTMSNNFPHIAANAAARLNFANQCVDLIKDYNFDGIDIDWEYPGYEDHEGSPQDKLNFNLLLDEVRVRLDALTSTTGKYYGLTAALPCGPTHVDNIDVLHVANVLDELLLMTYDFHGAWDTVTGVNSPLYYQGFGNPQFNLDSCVNRWKEKGAPSSKISIGIAFYGRSFKGASVLNEPHSGVDTHNWAVDEGLPQYFNIVKQLSAGTMTSIRHEATKTPFAYFKNGSGFISYDNERSICEKTGYVIDNNLKGFLIWEISGDLMDDLSTPLLDSLNSKLDVPSLNCDGGMINTPTSSPTNNIFRTESPSSTTFSTDNPTPSTISVPTKSPSSSSPLCPMNYTGLKATAQCTKFYHCVNGFASPSVSCPAGTLFDETIQVCNWADQVTCVEDTLTPNVSPTFAPIPISPTNCKKWS